MTNGYGYSNINDYGTILTKEEYNEYVSRLEVDEALGQLLDLQEADDPDADPGDITIDIQDDMALRVVFQKGKIIGMGGSVKEACNAALLNYKVSHDKAL